MNLSMVCPAKHDSAKFMRWVVLILPVFFCGCFETQSTRQLTRGQATGISSIGRFFIRGRDDSSQKPSEASTTQFSAAYSSDINVIPELAEDVSENRIAMPTFIGTGQSGLKNFSKTGIIAGGSSDRSQREQASSFRNAVSLVFNTPFNLIFSKVFKQSKSDEAAQESAQTVKDEVQNPFTEARLKQVSALTEDASSTKTDVSDNKTAATKQTASNDTKSGNNSRGCLRQYPNISDLHRHYR